MPMSDASLDHLLTYHMTRNPGQRAKFCQPLGIEKVNVFQLPDPLTPVIGSHKALAIPPL